MNTVVENVRLTVEEVEDSIKGRRRDYKVLRNEVDRRYFCPNPMCSEEKKWFKSQKTLNQHYAKVHAERELECKVCKKKFALERDMRYHEKKQHTRETPPEKPHAQRVKSWACKSCPMTFSRKCDLNDHTRKEHESHEKRFECVLCECSFETKEDVDNHFRETHSELVDSSESEQCIDDPMPIEEINVDESLQSILDQYIPIQPKPEHEHMINDQSNFADCPMQTEQSVGMGHYEMAVMPGQWSEESYASTQTEYNVTSSYSQTEWPNKPDHQQIPLLSYSYDYSTPYMERQDFGAQTYYVETQDFGTQMDSEMPSQTTYYGSSMAMNYESADHSSSMMDSGMCHVGTTSYYSDWTRHTETQTDSYYYQFPATEDEAIMTTFSNGSTQTNEVTYNHRMV